MRSQDKGEQNTRYLVKSSPHYLHHLRLLLSDNSSLLHPGAGMSETRHGVERAEQRSVPCLRSGSCFCSAAFSVVASLNLLLSLVCKSTSGLVRPCYSRAVWEYDPSIVHEMWPGPFPDRLDTINGWEQWAAHDHWANIRLDRAPLTRQRRHPDTKNCKNFIHNGNHILFVTQIYLPTFWGLE